MFVYLHKRFFFNTHACKILTISHSFPAMANGYVTFVISIAFIGACTAIIGDVAGHLGCFINLKDGVNAIAFVALGTSVPGTNSVSRVVPEACYISYIVASLSCLTVRFVPKKVSFNQSLIACHFLTTSHNYCTQCGCK